MNAIRHIKRAEVMGYCMGVKRAVEAAVKAVSINPEKKIFTFGPLIHNAETISMLEKKGIKTINPQHFRPASNYSDSIIVIRAHGISPDVLNQIKKSGADICDATCPRVVSSQMRAKKYTETHTVILAGDKNHGELIGIAGHVNSINKNNCIIVENTEEAKTIKVDSYRPVVLIAQTTIKQSEYEAIANILKERLPQELTVLNTICPATSERLKALKKLSEETDAILIVGGKNSANTKRLLQTALDTGKPAWQAENQDEIPEDIYSYYSVGISAGASTPSFVIDKIEQALKNRP